MLIFFAYEGAFKGGDHMLNNKSIGVSACLCPHLPERRRVSDYYTRRKKMVLLADHLLGHSPRQAGHTLQGTERNSGVVSTGPRDTYGSRGHRHTKSACPVDTAVC